MRKIKVIIFLFLCLFIVSFNDVKAYTKEDIINISYNIKPCSSRTKALINGYRASYLRLLNERNISQQNLNKIYNNIAQSIKILNSKGICSLEQKENVDLSTKNKLYSLYDEANDILVNSPMLSDNKKTDSKIIIDSTAKEIKIYQDGSLSDVIKLEAKLNYVGINKNVYILLFSLVLILTILTIVKIKKKNNFYLNGLIYTVILGIIGVFIFKNQISIAIDTISLMKVEKSTVTKKVKTAGNKIISYPLYGDKYGKIYINNDVGDLYFGDSTEILKKGVGQASISMMPGEGKTILSGHNTGILSSLFDVKKNNQIVIETVYGKFTYAVEKIEIINDSEIKSLENENDLIIYTCYPKGNLYGDKRLIVYSKMIKSEWIGDSNEK